MSVNWVLTRLYRYSNILGRRGNKETEMRCADCRDGEHENYDENIELVALRNPETKKFVKRAWLCKEHRKMYDEDGYEILRG